jgi:hypothetical protein
MQALDVPAKTQSGLQPAALVCLITKRGRFVTDTAHVVCPLLVYNLCDCNNVYARVKCTPQIALHMQQVD